MASILRQIVASPRSRHPEANLDLCYVTDNIIATSGPSSTYPKQAYRNPLKDLVKFLDNKHGNEWAIWEFRAEGTGYPDDEVYGRVRHYPWPDHHPPPFALIPLIMGSMKNWLQSEEAQGKGRVVVVHCKAGKGRSGTASCSYLISEEGWTVEDAMQRFTERRMRPGFGAGISIPSQIRTIAYVDRWTKHGKVYVERPVEVLEVHVWGLRDGVKIAVEGFVEEGKVIKTFHTFQSSEREVVRGPIIKDSGIADVAMEAMGRNTKKTGVAQQSLAPLEQSETERAMHNAQRTTDAGARSLGRSDSEQLTGEGGGDVVFRPSSRVVLPSSDINIDFERRTKTKYGGFTMVTSVAHVWFNAFFEGRGPEQQGRADDSGVFEIEWEAMDGIKGSSRKGTRALDKLAVVWRAVDLENAKPEVVMQEPAVDEEVQHMTPADWRGGEEVKQQRSDDSAKKLGLRAVTAESVAVSRASSVRGSAIHNGRDSADVPDESEGVKLHVPTDEELRHVSDRLRGTTGLSPLSQSQQSLLNVDGRAGTISGMQHLSTSELPDGVPEDELPEGGTGRIGSLHPAKGDGSIS